MVKEVLILIKAGVEMYLGVNRMIALMLVGTHQIQAKSKFVVNGFVSICYVYMFSKSFLLFRVFL